MDRRRLQGERRLSVPGIPGTPTSPQGHTRTGSGYGRKAQTKAAAQRLAAVMANKHNDDDGDGDDYDQLDHSTTSNTGGIGLGGSRATRPHSPMNKNVAHRRVPTATTQQADDDDDEDDPIVSGRPSIGLAGGRQMQGRTPVMKNIPQRRPSPVMKRPPADVDNDEDDLLVSGPTRLGLGGRAVRPQPLAVKTMAQRPAPHVSVSQPPSDEDNDEDDLANSTVSGKATIGLGGRARPSTSPLSVRVNQDQQQSTRSTPDTSLSVNTKEQSVPSHSRSQTSHSINSVEQPMSPSYKQASSVGRSASMINSSLVLPKPTSSVSTLETSADGQREKRLASDFGSTGNLKDKGREQSASALQDELDMLQDENGSLLEKLQLTEERCEEAEARARMLEKQIADLEECATLEAQLLSRKEASEQEKEAASGGGTQTLTPEQIAALQTEAEIARDETNSVLEKLSEKDFEIKALQTVTQRMMLTEEEMEEVVLKRCWLARYWSLCVEHGIQADIAGVKHEYWSSFAPLPVEIVLAAGQRARDEDIPSAENDLEEREKILQHTSELSGERNVESMLLVEKGLRELALLKVEDAVAYAMAKQRRQTMIKTEEVKLPTEGQFEVFELSQEESEDVRFKQAWLTYFWRRAMNHGVEADIADERLQAWVNRSSLSPTSQDAVDVERGLMEIRKLGLESQLWKTSRRGLEIGVTARLHIETGF